MAEPDSSSWDVDSSSSSSSSFARLSNTTTIQCRFYKQGTCRYGDSCRYLHENVETKSDPTHLSTSSTSECKLLLNWLDANAPEFIPSAAFVSTAATTSSETDFPAFGPPVESFSFKKNEGETDWVEPMSYARAVDPNAGRESQQIAQSLSELCPYYLMGSCRYEEECTYIHGETCELCFQNCLHPTDETQRLKHHEDCMKQHQVDMEKSFAVARSREKACGICMEVIWEKTPSTKQRFGLLPNCSHCFCLDCIRKWRQEKQFENKIIRSCPECRVQSDFICPSRYWCETREEKEQLITDYKKALSNKACKYFNQGHGECPFGNRCFYLHALPDGTRADVGPPKGKLRRRRIGQDDEEAEFFRVLLWDFLEERESRYVVQLGLDVDELDLFSSDSDDYLSDDGDSLFFLH